MSHSPHEYRKITPASGKGHLPAEVLIGAGLFGLVLLFIAMAVALGNEGANLATPTLVPLPTYESGGALAAGDILYTQGNLAFSFAAGPGYENPSLNTGECTAVTVDWQIDSGQAVFIDADGAYWVYAFRTDAAGINGWLPLDGLHHERPASCPAN